MPVTYVNPAICISNFQFLQEDSLIQFREAGEVICVTQSQRHCSLFPIYFNTAAMHNPNYVLHELRKPHTPMVGHLFQN